MRGFSLIEIMAVVAILGVLSALAVPSMNGMVDGYRALENARAVTSVVAQARGLAQRENAPVEVALFADHVELRVATISGTPEELRRTVTGYTAVRSVPLNGTTITTVKATAPTTTTTAVTPTTSTTFRVCASSDNYVRSSDLSSVCGAGNLASQELDINLVTSGKTHHIHVSQPMAAVNLISGAV